MAPRLECQQAVGVEGMQVTDYTRGGFVRYTSHPQEMEAARAIAPAAAARRPRGRARVLEAPAAAARAAARGPAAFRLLGGARQEAGRNQSRRARSEITDRAAKGGMSTMGQRPESASLLFGRAAECLRAPGVGGWGLRSVRKNRALRSRARLGPGGAG